MRRAVSLPILFLIFVLAPWTSEVSTARADADDVVFLKNGGRVRCVVLESDPETGARIKRYDGSIRVIEAAAIDHITYGGTAATPSAATPVPTPARQATQPSVIAPLPPPSGQTTQPSGVAPVPPPAHAPTPSAAAPVPSPAVQASTPSAATPVPSPAVQPSQPAVVDSVPPPSSQATPPAAANPYQPSWRRPAQPTAAPPSRSQREATYPTYNASPASRPQREEAHPTYNSSAASRPQREATYPTYNASPASRSQREEARPTYNSSGASQPQRETAYPTYNTSPAPQPQREEPRSTYNSSAASRPQREAAYSTSNSSQGALRIVSTEPGEVFIEGGEYGSTPLTVHNLSAGTHRVTIRFHAGDSDARQVYVRGGTETLVSFETTGSLRAYRAHEGWRFGLGLEGGFSMVGDKAAPDVRLLVRANYAVSRIIELRADARLGMFGAYLAFEYAYGGKYYDGSGTPGLMLSGDLQLNLGSVYTMSIGVDVGALIGVGPIAGGHISPIGFRLGSKRSVLLALQTGLTTGTGGGAVSFLLGITYLFL
jgi:hypothetical protein